MTYQPNNAPCGSANEPCRVHTKHVPNPHSVDRHHVWPTADGGPDIPENIVVVCPTGHRNIHDLLNLFKLFRGKPPYIELRKFAFEERTLAELGYSRIARGAM